MSVLVWATWAPARFAPPGTADWLPMHMLSFLSVAPLPVRVWVWVRPRPGRVRADDLVDVKPPVLQGKVAGAGGDG
jgi:hypothetical protein